MRAEGRLGARREGKKLERGFMDLKYWGMGIQVRYARGIVLEKLPRRWG